MLPMRGERCDTILANRGVGEAIGMEFRSCRRLQQGDVVQSNSPAHPADMHSCYSLVLTAPLQSARSAGSLLQGTSILLNQVLGLSAAPSTIQNTNKLQFSAASRLDPV